MASTYSPLKIQLMATGENSGTWGNVTNDNLGIAIEEAIVGSADVTFASADVTLTLTDTNATQPARNLRLNLTGTVAAPQNLIVPAIEKVYIINNGLSQTITVKNSTGTGIAVPAGKTMYVYNNGTNVVDAITHLTSLTVANAFSADTISGNGAGITTLNASNISSGTLANARTTASSSNGASTIVARGASGEFAAGTITATFSGDGSGVTAINANNISTGTLAVARGGTGATTLTSEAVIIGNTTSAVKFVSPGTTGNVLTSNGTAWLSQASGMVYPGAGMAVSTGSAWTTSKTTPTGDVVGTSDTQTLTNKRIDPRVVAAGATSGNLTIAGDTTDVYKAEGLTGAITFLQPSGTPVDGQRLVIRIEDNGTARGITWTTSSGAFRAVGITLPTTTVLGKVTYVGCMYNSTDTFWDAIATVTQA